MENFHCIGWPTDNGQSSINKQNTSKLLLYKLYFKMILKMILKSFEFQCDFDFQITTSKMIWILILNHLYLGDLILILKSSTCDDFAHLCVYIHIIYRLDIHRLVNEVVCIFRKGHCAFYSHQNRKDECNSIF